MAFPSFFFLVEEVLGGTKRKKVVDSALSLFISVLIPYSLLTPTLGVTKDQ